MTPPRAEASITVSEQRDLRARILGVLPVGSFEMEQFLSLCDVRLSHRTETACVTVGPEPALLLNPQFLARWCRSDEHLLLLVLHELYHILMGHTSLFPRATIEDNIAFDAVINAQLCHLFPEPAYISFFRSVNPRDTLPARLLRPPDGWPNPNWQPSPKAGEAERAVIRLLYGKAAPKATYAEILRLILQPLDESKGRACVLLGDHSGPGRLGQEDEAAAGDDVMTGIIHRVASRWPTRAAERLGRGDGTEVVGCRLGARTPRAEFLAAFADLLRGAAIHLPDRPTNYAWRPSIRPMESITVIPNLRDRQAAARAEVQAEPQLIYRTEVEARRPRWMPGKSAHIYLDISGSMGDNVQWLVGALEPLVRSGACKLFVFSTVVDTVRGKRISMAEVRNTYGTDIDCVLEHLLSLPQWNTPRKVVILTDGYTGSPDTALMSRLGERRVALHVGVTNGGSHRDLEKDAQRVVRLPPLGGSRRV